MLLKSCFIHIGLSVLVKLIFIQALERYFRPFIITDFFTTTNLIKFEMNIFYLYRSRWMLFKLWRFLQAWPRDFSPSSVIISQLETWYNLKWIFAYYDRSRWMLFKVWWPFKASPRTFSPLSLILWQLQTWSNLKWIFTYLDRSRWMLFKVWRCFQAWPRYFSPLSLIS